MLGTNDALDFGNGKKVEMHNTVKTKAICVSG